MHKDRNQRFDVSSMGQLFRISLAMFAHHLEDENGGKLSMDELRLNQRFFVVYESGNGFTRTSAKRIA